jgi:hypothetical protein
MVQKRLGIFQLFNLENTSFVSSNVDRSLFIIDLFVVVCRVGTSGEVPILFRNGWLNDSC